MKNTKRIIDVQSNTTPLMFKERHSRMKEQKFIPKYIQRPYLIKLPFYLMFCSNGEKTYIKQFLECKTMRGFRQMPT